MDATTEANVQLVELWRRTGWSRKELARRVNQRARRRDLNLHTDATRIRNWLAGQHPQLPVPRQLVADLRLLRHIEHRRLFDHATNRSDPLR